MDWFVKSITGVDWFHFWLLFFSYIQVKLMNIDWCRGNCHPSIFNPICYLKTLTNCWRLIYQQRVRSQTSITLLESTNNQQSWNILFTLVWVRWSNGLNLTSLMERRSASNANGTERTSSYSFTCFTHPATQPSPPHTSKGLK